MIEATLLPISIFFLSFFFFLLLLLPETFCKNQKIWVPISVIKNIRVYIADDFELDFEFEFNFEFDLSSISSSIASSISC